MEQHVSEQYDEQSESSMATTDDAADVERPRPTEPSPAAAGETGRESTSTARPTPEVEDDRGSTPR